MKVLLASNHHGQLAGGAVAMMRVTEELLHAAGHETISFAIREEANFPSHSRKHFPTVTALRGQPLPSDETGASPYSFPARRRLRRLIADRRPDVAHLHNVFSKLTLSIVDALHAEAVPTVFTLHEYKAVCPNGTLYTRDGICHRCVHGGRYWNAVRHRCLDGSLFKSTIAATEAYLNRFRKVLDKVDVFISPSEFLRDVVSAGLPAGRVEVIPNPAYAADDLSSRVVDRAPRFVYSGRLIPQKGLDVLLDAVGLVERGVTVLVYGEGPLESHLRERVDRERLPVELRGYADNDAIARELDRCVASLTPSLWYENCPMAVLEAAGRGVATVASDLGGMSELVDHKETGILVPPGDAHSLASALTALSEAPRWALQLGRAAWKRACRRHDPAQYVAGVIKAYERALVRARRGDSVGRASRNL